MVPGGGGEVVPGGGGGGGGAEVPGGSSSGNSGGSDDIRTSRNKVVSGRFGSEIPNRVVRSCARTPPIAVAQLAGGRNTRDKPPSAASLRCNVP